MSGRLSLVLAVVGVCGALAVGCGGGDDTSTTVSTSSSTTVASAPALTKEQFIAQADAICAAGDKSINSAIKALGSTGQPSQADLQQFATVAVPTLQEEVDAIGALPPPGGDTDEVSAILDAVQNGVDQIKSDPSSIESDPLQDASQLAQEYGLQECGSD
jgi:hypothetical protein